MDRLGKIASLMFFCGATMGIHQTARADEITAVSSKVSDDYVRNKLADGSFEPEAYAFGEGGQWQGETDPSIDKLHFTDVARAIAGPLATRKYLPAKDPKQTKLLILVYWGTTTGPTSTASSVSFQNTQVAANNLAKAKNESTGRGGDLSKGPSVFEAEQALLESVQMVEAENRQRDLTNIRNGLMLGYDAELEANIRLKHTYMDQGWKDVIDELEDDRYFVVLMAYDFQLLWKEKKHKLLWETRFSIRQRHNAFDQQLAAMAQEASRYFGKDSHGVRHKPLPEGDVNFGELKVIGIVPEKK
jgi:hypothetical protein